MNKITSTLAGLAFVAAASVAPAFAQGNFTATGPFTFSLSPTNFSLSDVPVSYNPTGASGTTLGELSLTGGITGPQVFTNTTLNFVEGTFSGGTFTPDGFTLTDMIPFTTVVEYGSGNYSIASVGKGVGGTTFNLAPGAPVPEASTVVSFGALLALGGLAVLRRKSVKNAA